MTNEARDAAVEALCEAFGRWINDERRPESVGAAIDAILAAARAQDGRRCKCGLPTDEYGVHREPCLGHDVVMAARAQGQIDPDYLVPPSRFQEVREILCPGPGEHTDEVARRVVREREDARAEIARLKAENERLMRLESSKASCCVENEEAVEEIKDEVARLKVIDADLRAMLEIDVHEPLVEHVFAGLRERDRAKEEARLLQLRVGDQARHIAHVEAALAGPTPSPSPAKALESRAAQRDKPVETGASSPAEPAAMSGAEFIEAAHKLLPDAFAEVAEPLAGDGPVWRVGRKLGRTLYEGDEFRGLLETRGLAQVIADALNEDIARAAESRGRAAGKIEGLRWAESVMPEYTRAIIRFEIERLEREAKEGR